MKGKVSIWLGHFESQEDLQDYTKENYTENGDLTCTFYTDFGIKYIDNQFREVAFSEPITVELIEQASYSESFMDSIEDGELSNYNSIILCYDYDYDGNVQTKNRVTFYKVLSYDDGI